MKEEKYKELIRDIKSLTTGEDDVITIMSTIACEIFHSADFINWAGFYRVVGDRTLKVGPYQGGHGCLVISYDRGVCGRCAADRTPQIVEDVTKLKYHIACSSETRSEIVLPVFNSVGELIAVLDIDSLEVGSFDDVDLKYLSEIVNVFKSVI
ncbi:MAG: GAF domain-containing protein [Candidatus Delongbacteria bacterium]|jgi:L-methionine (R)-S-oxide reductase|nr:GAF domain-containing protein [Candidatus Delongbacteria bacterium]